MQNATKGRLLEKIAASLHTHPGARVSTNVRLPTLLNPDKKREFDVVVETQALGYDIRFIIECKNLNIPLDSSYVDAFKGKLGAVGAPTNQAILVSRNGFTKDAAAYAEQHGIRAFTIEGLTKNGLNSLVEEVLYSSIFYKCSIIQIIFFTGTPPIFFGPIYNEDGGYIGTFQDLIWHVWNNGYPPLKVGEYQVNIDLQRKFYQLDENQTKNFLETFAATLLVEACVLDLKGEGYVHTLVRENTGKPERFESHIQIPIPSGEHLLQIFKTESELNEHLGAKAKIRLKRHIKLPRIRALNCYWPPCTKGLKKIEDLVSTYTSGKTHIKPIFSAEDVEGSMLNLYFEEYDREWISYYEKTLARDDFKKSFIRHSNENS